MADLESLYEAILKGKLDVAKAVTTEAIAENIDPHLIINNYMSRRHGRSRLFLLYQGSSAFGNCLSCSIGSPASSPNFAILYYDLLFPVKR